MTDLHGDSPPDFSEPRQRNRFVIDGEEFEAAGALPARRAMACIALSERGTQASPSEAETLYRELFALVLLPESFERFATRLDDLERPITLEQIPRITEWLFERYGMRPTEESSDSSTGSANPAAGTNSTGGSPPQALIPTGSPSTAS